MAKLCLTELVFHYDTYICKLIELSSNDDTIQKNIASYLYLINTLKQNNIIGNEIDHQIYYIEMHRHKQCTPDDISWLNEFLKPDDIIKRKIFTFVLEYRQNKLPNILALYYGTDWSVVKHDEISFLKIFEIVATFHRLQSSLITKEYAEEYNEKNIQPMIDQLRNYNLRLVNLFSVILKNKGKSLSENICHHLNLKLRLYENTHPISSNFIENECKRNTIQSRR
ncbi:hypothetical protein HZS_4361, partial [Henneguya salminicola]